MSINTHCTYMCACMYFLLWFLMWLYGGAKFGLEDECIEVKLRAGKEVEMTVKVEVTAGAGRRMTLEDTRLRKQTLWQAWSPSKPGGRTRGQFFCEYLLAINCIRQCGIFWFKLWSPKGLTVCRGGWHITHLHNLIIKTSSVVSVVSFCSRENYLVI